MYFETFSRIAAVILGAVLLTDNAFGQQGLQSIRTPVAPQYQTFTPNAAGGTLVRVGPFSGSAGVRFGYDFNDNANTTATGKVSANELNQSLDLDLVWILSPFNRVDVALTGLLEENFYSNGTNTVNVAIFPGSQINLQARVGDVLLQAFEQLSVVQDPVSDPAVGNQTNLNRLTNTVGAGVTVPIHPVDLGFTFNYTYSDTLGSTGVPGGNGNSNNVFSSSSGGVRNSLSLGVNLGVEVGTAMSTGIDFNGSVNYGAGENDVDAISFGPFLRGHLTHLIELDSGIGPLFTGASRLNQTGFYAYLSIRYQVTTISQLVFGIDHDVNFSSGLNLAKNNNFHVDLETSPTRRWTVVLGPFVNFGTGENGTSPGSNGTSSGSNGTSSGSNGTLSGSYTQYGVSVGSTFQLNQKLTAGVEYRFARREGEQSTDRYIQNIIGFNLGYRF